jgi:hypothetical protein
VSAQAQPAFHTPHPASCIAPRLRVRWAATGQGRFEAGEVAEVQGVGTGTKAVETGGGALSARCPLLAVWGPPCLLSGSDAPAADDHAAPSNRNRPFIISPRITFEVSHVAAAPPTHAQAPPRASPPASRPSCLPAQRFAPFGAVGHPPLNGTRACCRLTRLPPPCKPLRCLCASWGA